MREDRTQESSGYVSIRTLGWSLWGSVTGMTWPYSSMYLSAQGSGSFKIESDWPTMSCATLLANGMSQAPWLTLPGPSQEMRVVIPQEDLGCHFQKKGNWILGWQNTTDTPSEQCSNQCVIYSKLRKEQLSLLLILIKAWGCRQLLVCLMFQELLPRMRWFSSGSIWAQWPMALTQWMKYKATYSVFTRR